MLQKMLQHLFEHDLDTLRDAAPVPSTASAAAERSPWLPRPRAPSPRTSARSRYSELLVHFERHRIADVVHLQRCAILDRTPDAVVTEVTFLHAVLQRTEITVRVHHRPVDRRAGKAEAKAVRELHPHGHRVAFGAVTFLDAVSLVDEADDVVSCHAARGRPFSGRTEWSSRAYHASRCRSFVLQIFNAQRLFDVRIIAGVEIVGQLRLQVAPIDHDQDGRIIQSCDGAEACRQRTPSSATSRTLGCARSVPCDPAAQPACRPANTVRSTISFTASNCW